jgi:hypothetical protein
LAGLREGLVGFIEHAGEPDEHVRDVGCDLQRHWNAVRGGPGGGPGGVVEEDLVAADLDQQGREAGEVSEHGADVTVGQVVAVRVVAGATTEPVGGDRGSAAAFVVMLAPVVVRSAQGEAT